MVGALGAIGVASLLLAVPSWSGWRSSWNWSSGGYSGRVNQNGEKAPHSYGAPPTSSPAQPRVFLTAILPRNVRREFDAGDYPPTSRKLETHENSMRKLPPIAANTGTPPTPRRSHCDSGLLSGTPRHYSSMETTSVSRPASTFASDRRCHTMLGGSLASSASSAKRLNSCAGRPCPADQNRRCERHCRKAAPGAGRVAEWQGNTAAADGKLPAPLQTPSEACRHSARNP